MKKILLFCINIIGYLPLDAFPIVNQTGHNVYVRIAFAAGPSAAPMHRGQMTGFGPKMMVKAGTTKKVTVPPLLTAYDRIQVLAFFSDAAGLCYADSVLYNAGDLNTPAGLVLRKGPLVQSNNTQSIMWLNSSFGGNGACDIWYNNLLTPVSPQCP